MAFTSAAACEQICWQMRLADWPRARNRAQLNELYNGFPPFTEDEQRQNRIQTNTNFLDGPTILHDGRRQLNTAFCSTPQLFTVNCDYGPVWRKREWSTIITNSINRIIKRNREYLDCQKSTFASLVLHGIGPAVWEKRQSWCPEARGVEDILIPSNTLTSLKNLPFFGIFKSYTGKELWDMTHGPRVDKGWNMDVVNAALKWVWQQTASLMNPTWPQYWAPEKMAEQFKQDGGLFSGDAAPTVDVIDFYFWEDAGKKSGWRRRMVLDAWGDPGIGGAGGILPNQTREMPADGKNIIGTSGAFLYTGGDRVYGTKIDELVHFQFADCSAVAPFRYHSVRSLGFLLYSVCQLQNRLRCKFNDHLFESLIQYFRVANESDAERATKIDLIDRGIVTDGVNFVTPNERWQIQQGIVEMGFSLNDATMSKNSASYTQDVGVAQKPDETATAVMAKVNSSAALIGSMLGDAYDRQNFQYIEICRRFCMADSNDPDVKRFRLECLKAGVPKEALNSERWTVQPVRVIGSGNKMLQVAMADKLMTIRPLLDAQGQAVVTKIYVLANSDDPALADQIVPDAPHISSSIQQAQMSFGTLMQGGQVDPVPGVNHEEYVETMLHEMALAIQRLQQNGGMATAEQIFGLQNTAGNISGHIKLLAQDKSAKQKVKQYGDELGKLMNFVKAFSQRLQEQQKAQAQNGQQLDPKDAAKIQATMLTAKTKAQIAAENHANKTAQRQVQFQQKLKQDAEIHNQEIAKEDLKTAAELRRDRFKSFQE
jgi:hypothetical protein